MKGIIYMYRFPDNKVYIGQTRRLEEIRKREHIDANVGPTNSGFWEAYQRFGEYEYRILHEIEKDNVDELVAELNDWETLYIRRFKADSPLYGYNRKSFGTVGTKSKKIIDSKFREIRAELIEPNMQIYKSAIRKIWETKEPLTQEEKYLIKEKYREQNFHQKHIDEYDFDNLGKNDLETTEFMVDTYLDAVHFMIINDAEGEAWNYIVANYDRILDEERKKNAIVQIDKNGNIIKEFYSFNEICQTFNILKADNVRNVLHGKQKTAYGFLWKYKKDL